MKKRNKLYEYLEAKGVLVNGTANDIEQTKRQYWIEVRKEWRKQQRRECKSYTVFLNEKEYKHISAVAKTAKRSITRFIKSAALQKALGSAGIDERITGSIRESFFETYNALQENQTVPQSVLRQLLHLERTVLTLLNT